MSGPYKPGPYQPGPYQGPYKQGPYQQGPYPRVATRRRPGTRRASASSWACSGSCAPGSACSRSSWADGSKGGFTDLSSAARKAGSDGVGNTALYLYLARAGYVLFAAALVLTVLALLPLPSSAAGNTYARVGAALAAGVAAVLHIWTMHKLFRGDATPHLGAWLGLLGYLTVLAATIIGARRVVG